MILHSFAVSCAHAGHTKNTHDTKINKNKITGKFFRKKNPYVVALCYYAHTDSHFNVCVAFNFLSGWGG